MTDPNLQRSVRARADILTRTVGGELLLLELGSEQYYGLDEIGAAMWEAITSTPSLEAARDQLVDTFDAPPDQITADLLELVDGLVSAGLLDEADG